MIYIPGKHTGLYTVHGQPTFISRRGAMVQCIAASEHDNIQKRLENHLPYKEATRPFVVEMSNALTVMENVKFMRGCFSVNDNFVLSGAAGDRFYSELAKSGEKQTPEFNRSIWKQASDLPVWQDRLPTEAVVDCRNFFNFYHFLTETAPLINDLVRSGAKHIKVISRGAEVKSFIEDWVSTLSKSKVTIELTCPKSEREKGISRYDNVLGVFNPRHHLYMHSAPNIQNADRLDIEDYIGPHVARRNYISQHFVSSNTISMANHLLNRARKFKAENRSYHFPEKVVIARQSSRSRSSASFNNLVDTLCNEHGFSVVVLETMSPYHQMMIWNNAKVVIAEHGAALAGMMFASKNTHVIELANVQVRFHRWGDFLQNAHVSGCKYTTLFADAECEDPSNPPHIGTQFCGPQLGPKALNEVYRLLNL
jgi:capsular polysaccharide biosynthesis protein